MEFCFTKTLLLSVLEDGGVGVRLDAREAATLLTAASSEHRELKDDEPHTLVLQADADDNNNRQLYDMLLVSVPGHGDHGDDEKTYTLVCGWQRYVKTNSLKAGDVIFLYKHSEERDLGIKFLKPRNTCPNGPQNHSVFEKQATELAESCGRVQLENLNSRERKIQDIVASFEASKLKPVHATNPELKPIKILPLFPDFDRYDEDKFVVANFGNALTADSDNDRKLSATDWDEFGQRAIMKSLAENPNKFLVDMVSSVEDEDKCCFLFTYGDSEVKYLPLQTRLKLRKKRARRTVPCA